MEMKNGIEYFLKFVVCGHSFLFLKKLILVFIKDALN